MNFSLYLVVLFCPATSYVLQYPKKESYTPIMIGYIHTIALSSDVVNDENQIEKVISYVEEWNVEGVYIVCEHPVIKLS